MLRGMRVVLHNLQNHTLLNGLRGNVLSVRDDDRLCVQLDKGSKFVVVRAKHVLEWESANTRNVQTFEFVEGTSLLLILFIYIACATNRAFSVVC